MADDIILNNGWEISPTEYFKKPQADYEYKIIRRKTTKYLTPRLASTLGMLECFLWDYARLRCESKPPEALAILLKELTVEIFKSLRMEIEDMISIREDGD